MASNFVLVAVVTAFATVGISQCNRNVITDGNQNEPKDYSKEHEKFKTGAPNDSILQLTTNFVTETYQWNPAVTTVKGPNDEKLTTSSFVNHEETGDRKYTDIFNEIDGRKQLHKRDNRNNFHLKGQRRDKTKNNIQHKHPKRSKVTKRLIKKTPKKSHLRKKVRMNVKKYNSGNILQVEGKKGDKPVKNPLQKNPGSFLLVNKQDHDNPQESSLFDNLTILTPTGSHSYENPLLVNGKDSDFKIIQYIHSFNQLIQQNARDNFDDLLRQNSTGIHYIKELISLLFNNLNDNPKNYTKPSKEDSNSTHSLDEPGKVSTDKPGKVSTDKPGKVSTDKPREISTDKPRKDDPVEHGEDYSDELGEDSTDKSVEDSTDELEEDYSEEKEDFDEELSDPQGPKAGVSKETSNQTTADSFFDKLLAYLNKNNETNLKNPSKAADNNIYNVDELMKTLNSDKKGNLIKMFLKKNRPKRKPTKKCTNLNDLRCKKKANRKTKTNLKKRVNKQPVSNRRSSQDVRMPQQFQGKGILSFNQIKPYYLTGDNFTSNLYRENPIVHHFIVQLLSFIKSIINEDHSNYTHPLSDGRNRMELGDDSIEDERAKEREILNKATHPMKLDECSSNNDNQCKMKPNTSLDDIIKRFADNFHKDFRSSDIFNKQ